MNVVIILTNELQSVNKLIMSADPEETRLDLAICNYPCSSNHNLINLAVQAERIDVLSALLKDPRIVRGRNQGYIEAFCQERITEK